MEIERTGDVGNVNNDHAYKYLLIPSDKNQPIVEKLGDNRGGLSNDDLVGTAKKYFQDEKKKLGSSNTSNQYLQLPAEQKKIIANSIRQKTGNAAALSHVSDDDILQMLETSQNSASCNIIAVTVPTKVNNFQAVSMYTSQDDDESSDVAVNMRAVSFLHSMGHTNANCKGDVFIGRCIDDENGDVWKRVDFSIVDLSSESEWCRIAKLKGGGGSSAGGKPFSLNGLISGQQEHQQQKLSHDTSAQRDGYTWSQNDEEVEIIFVVRSVIKSKSVKLSVSNKSGIKLLVAGEKLLSGMLGGHIMADDCTYTLSDINGANADSKKKELVLTLCKKDNGVEWPFPVKK